MGLLAPGDRLVCVPLDGGVSSDIWRIEIGARKYCLKRALAQLKVSQFLEAPIGGIHSGSPGGAGGDRPFHGGGLTLRGLVTYYVLFFIHLESRKVDIAGITVHPDQPLMQQMSRNVSMEGCGTLLD